MTKNTLPFELSSDAVAIWLNFLNQNNIAKSAVELNSAVKILREHKSKSSEVFKALVLITPKVITTCNSIELAFSTKNHSGTPSLKIIRLCIQLLRNMGLAFCKINDLKNVSKDEQNTSIYFALQLIGHSQRLSAIFHETPSSSLWNEIGNIYHSALKEDSSQHKINHNIPTFKSQLTIESVLKRIILFNISNPYLYSAKQIKELFLIISMLADKLVLNNITTSSINTFYWDSNSRNAPCAINSILQDQQLVTTINTEDVISTIQSNNFVCNLDPDALFNIIDHLSGYQSVINNPIPSAPAISHLLIGFDNISEYLTKVSTLKKIQKLSTQITPLDTLENTKIEDMDVTSNPQSKNTSSTNLEFLSKAKAVKSLQVNSKNLVIAETSYIECNIGDIALFCYADLTNKIGIIRQIKITNISKTVHILIEEISGTPSTLQLSKTPSQISEHEIIVIDAPMTQRVLLPYLHKLSNGGKLSCVADKKISLESLIDYSPFFSLYQTS